MARILVNYIYNKTKDQFKILDQGCVLADQKVAVLETEEQIGEPLVVPINDVMTIVDRKRYELLNKKYKLSANNNSEVVEDENGVEVWLPRETDISKLRYIHGRLVMITEEDKKEEKPSKKKNSNKEA